MCEKFVLKSDEICIKSIDCFVRQIGYSIIILLIHKQETLFPFLESFSIYFSLKFFIIQVFYFLGRIHLNLISEAVVNYIIFLISFSACSYVAYKKDTGFCVLILSPAAFMHTFIILGVFWWILLASIMYKIMPSVNRDTSFSYFLVVFFLPPLCILFLQKRLKNLL